MRWLAGSACLPSLLHLLTKNITTVAQHPLHLTGHGCSPGASCSKPKMPIKRFALAAMDDDEDDLFKARYHPL